MRIINDNLFILTFICNFPLETASMSLVLSPRLMSNTALLLSMIPPYYLVTYTSCPARTSPRLDFESACIVLPARACWQSQRVSPALKYDAVYVAGERLHAISFTVRMGSVISFQRIDKFMFKNLFWLRQTRNRKISHHRRP